MQQIEQCAWFLSNEASSFDCIIAVECREQYTQAMFPWTEVAVACNKRACVSELLQTEPNEVSLPC